MSEGAYYFPFLYQRFLSSTMGWKDEQVGAYVRLLIKQFDEGCIPGDLDSICLISPGARKHWTLISKKFKANEDGTLYNEVMKGIRDKHLAKSEKNKENGNKGGRPLKNRTVIPEKPNGYENDNHSANHTNMVNGLMDKGFVDGGMGEVAATRQPIVQAMKDHWLSIKPQYPFSHVDDLQALFEIGEFMAPQLKTTWLPEDDVGYRAILEAWKTLANWISGNDFYTDWSLSTIAKTKNLQTIWQKSRQLKNGTTTHKPGSTKTAGANELAAGFAAKLAALGAANSTGKA